ncbi:hypothetical protein NMG60_11019602 [Bertholletia excelsa]
MLIGIRGTTGALKEEVQRLEQEKLQFEMGEKETEVAATTSAIGTEAAASTKEAKASCVAT